MIYFFLNVTLKYNKFFILFFIFLQIKHENNIAIGIHSIRYFPSNPIKHNLKVLVTSRLGQPNPPKL